jgi:hypothetical protein
MRRTRHESTRDRIPYSTRDKSDQVNTVITRPHHFPALSKDAQQGSTLGSTRGELFVI